MDTAAPGGAKLEPRLSAPWSSAL